MKSLNDYLTISKRFPDLRASRQTSLEIPGHRRNQIYILRARNAGRDAHTMRQRAGLAFSVNLPSCTEVYLSVSCRGLCRVYAYFTGRKLRFTGGHAA